MNGVSPSGIGIEQKWVPNTESGESMVTYSTEKKEHRVSLASVLLNEFSPCTKLCKVMKVVFAENMPVIFESSNEHYKALFYAAPKIDNEET
jgi:hypothetical protein